MVLTADMVPIRRYVPFWFDRLPKILHVESALVQLFWHCHDKAVMLLFCTLSSGTTNLRQCFGTAGGTDVFYILKEGVSSDFIK